MYRHLPATLLHGKRDHRDTFGVSRSAGSCRLLLVVLRAEGACGGCHARLISPTCDDCHYPAMMCNRSLRRLTASGIRSSQCGNSCTCVLFQHSRRRPSISAIICLTMCVCRWRTRPPVERSGRQPSLSRFAVVFLLPVNFHLSGLMPMVRFPNRATGEHRVALHF